MTPVPPTLVKQTASALSNSDLTLSTGVDGQITGVYNDTCFHTVRRNTEVESNVGRITPPNPIRRRVEVEDADNDDEDDDKTNEISHASQVEGCNDHVNE